MKLSDVYTRAAEHIDSHRETFCCWAIGAAIGVETGETNPAEEAFHSLYYTPDDRHPDPLGNGKRGAYFHSMTDAGALESPLEWALRRNREARSHRVFALLFAAEIARDQARTEALRARWRKNSKAYRKRWRFLEAGECRRAGDQYKFNGEWKPALLMGPLSEGLAALRVYRTRRPKGGV